MIYKTAAFTLLCFALAGCAGDKTLSITMPVMSPNSGQECAPNGTCWPANYQVTKQARVFHVEQPARVCDLPLKVAGWGKYLSNKKILACTIGKKLKSPIVYLPKKLPTWAAREGWSLELLRRYELANVEGVAVYPVGTPARPSGKGKAGV